MIPRFPLPFMDMYNVTIRAFLTLRPLPKSYTENGALPMSKNSIEKSSFRRYSPKARIAGPRKNFLDHFAGWLGSRSRLVRSVIAAVVALILTGALVLVSYGLLLSLTSNELLV